jgi:hypothetical protein
LVLNYYYSGFLNKIIYHFWGLGRNHFIIDICDGDEERRIVDIFFWCRDGYKINALVSDIIYDI